MTQLDPFVGGHVINYSNNRLLKGSLKKKNNKGHKQLLVDMVYLFGSVFLSRDPWITY